MTQNDERLSKLFRALVPPSGKADSLAGELVRATMKISYRSFNDGDRIGVGYGKETCNAPARFLMAHCPVAITEVVDGLWGLHDDDEYEGKLDVLVGMVADYVANNPELRDTATEDMWDYFRPGEDRDDSWDDEEDEEEEASL